MPPTLKKLKGQLVWTSVHPSIPRSPAPPPNKFRFGFCVKKCIYSSLPPYPPPPPPPPKKKKKEKIPYLNFEFIVTKSLTPATHLPPPTNPHYPIFFILDWCINAWISKNLAQLLSPRRRSAVQNICLRRLKVKATLEGQMIKWS